MLRKKLLECWLALLLIKCSLASDDNSNKTERLTVQFTKKLALHQTTDTLLICYSVVIVVLGVLLNMVNFACFYRMKKRNAQNLYLGALSAAEILNILVNIGVPLFSRLTRHTWLARLLDQLTAPFLEFFCILNSYLVEVGILPHRTSENV